MPSGNYVFDNLPPGTYHVAEEQKPGWVQTTPAGGFHQVTLVSGQIVEDADFGNREIEGGTGEIRGRSSRT